MAKIKGNFEVVNELCSCGHLRSRHYPHGHHESLDGHGYCEECECKKFTWVALVVK